MRYVLLLLCLPLALAACDAGPGPDAPDITGTYTGLLDEGSPANHAVTFVLVQQGQSVTGSYSGTYTAPTGTQRYSYPLMATYHHPSLRIFYEGLGFHPAEGFPAFVSDTGDTIRIYHGDGSGLWAVVTRTD